MKKQRQRRALVVSVLANEGEMAEKKVERMRERREESMRGQGESCQALISAFHTQEQLEPLCLCPVETLEG